MTRITKILSIAALVIAAAFAHPTHVVAEESSGVFPALTTLRDWQRQPFYNGASTAYFTYLVKSPTRPGGFRAWGIDVDHNAIVFNIQLTDVQDLRAFQRRLNKELSDLLDADLLGQIVIETVDLTVGPPPIDPLGSGGDQLGVRLIDKAVNSIRGSSFAVYGARDDVPR